ncbi:MAG: hypothetical protein BWY61_01568 [Firmicutes bacterium ADurb.Bin354]|nr:MAG: hypothetical protein BWY61_01568 [Firmicutes bacterium ADurb.Bin354]
MKSCNTVYGVAGTDSEMSHLNLSVIDDRHLANLLLVTGIFSLDLKNKAAVDLFNDLIDPGKKS